MFLPSVLGDLFGHPPVLLLPLLFVRVRILVPALVLHPHLLRLLLHLHLLASCLFSYPFSLFSRAQVRGQIADAHAGTASVALGPQELVADLVA